MEEERTGTRVTVCIILSIALVLLSIATATAFASNVVSNLIFDLSAREAGLVAKFSYATAFACFISYGLFTHIFLYINKRR